MINLITKTEAGSLAIHPTSGNNTHSLENILENSLEKGNLFLLLLGFLKQGGANLNLIVLIKKWKVHYAVCNSVNALYVIEGVIVKH